jgi:hypothetical protein
LPISLVAACFGRWLGRKAGALPIFTLGAWALYVLSPLPSLNVMPAPAVNTLPKQALWEVLLLWPTSTLLSVLLPAYGLILGYRLSRGSARP